MRTIKHKSFLKRSSVRKKRLGPARRGRVIDTAFIEWIHKTQCCLIGSLRGHYWCSGRGTFHHIREHGSPKNDRRGLYLCEGHHLHDFGPESIERLGKAEFEKRHGISIEAAIAEYNRQYEQEASTGAKRL